MFEGNYSKFLTIILIVIIIAILGLAGFLGYDFYKKFYIEKDAQDAMNAFDNKVKENNIKENNNTTGDEELVAPVINGTGETTNTVGSSGTKKATYKGYGMAGKIEIPKTSCNYPVLDKLSKESIEIAVAIMCGPGLNQPGNTVIVGHNYRNGTFFSNNKKLEEGDKIYITDSTGEKVQYTIYRKYTTSPEDSDYINRDTEGRREISLSTCTDDVKSRIIIWAKAD